MVRLLPRDALVKTGPVDHADWNYRPVLGWIQRLRFRLILDLLPRGKVGRLLEIGYGSGVFMPELATRCEELFGIDVHPFAAEVQSRLKEHGVTAELGSGSAEELPYAPSTFDAVVAVSSLEFVPDAAAAAREIRRVLKPGGCLVLVTPGHSPLVDWGLRVLTGASAKQDYAGRREQLMPALESQFACDAKRTFPPVLSGIVCLYTALSMRPLESTR
jgi:ubiquinone/menaquinone biosynthesis C-methylase UbiE